MKDSLSIAYHLQSKGTVQEIKLLEAGLISYTYKASALEADIPDTPGETIPDFRNIEFHLKQLRNAVATNAAKRAKEVPYFLDKIEKTCQRNV